MLYTHSDSRTHQFVDFTANHALLRLEGNAQRLSKQLQTLLIQVLHPIGKSQSAGGGFVAFVVAGRCCFVLLSLVKF